MANSIGCYSVEDARERRSIVNSKKFYRIRRILLLVAKGAKIMKTTMKQLTILALALTVFAQYTSARAGGGTSNGRFRDLGSEAYFYSQ
jgi:hypothetical protein